MTSVYLVYAREDRESARRVSDMLQFEGWDVWMDPSDPSQNAIAALNTKLATAGAILVLWSDVSRRSPYARSEAAIGLAKSKLIQASLDGAGAPDSFGQLELLQLQGWAGERDHWQWRRLTEVVRLYAGAAGAQSLPLQNRPAAKTPFLTLPKALSALLVIAGLLAAGGGGVWLADPFGWRKPQASPIDGRLNAVALVSPTPPSERPPVSGIEDKETPQSLQAWESLDRRDPSALAAFLEAFPGTASAQTARTLLRVMDAEAWVKAVTADNEAGYLAYLARFPPTGVHPGAMAVAASDRIGTLRTERTQVLMDIQKGLARLNLYDGAIDGGVNETLRAAVRTFAAQALRSAPSLGTAAPRELRAFAEAIGRAVPVRPGELTSGPPAPATATSGTSVDFAAEADRVRIAQAQAAAEAAQLAQTAAGVAAGAAYPAAGGLSDTSSFSIGRLPVELAAVVATARRAGASAYSRAGEARQAASRALGSKPSGTDAPPPDALPFLTTVYGVLAGQRGMGAGERYLGQLVDGRSHGVGVHEFAGDAGAGADAIVRYEGEYQDGAAVGAGVTYWRSGDRFAGVSVTDGPSRGVINYADGRRYEGEVRDGRPYGLGAMWSSKGAVLRAGAWTAGQPAGAATRPERP